MAGSGSEALLGEEFLRRLEVLHLAARRLHAGRARADRRSRLAGAGVELADHRDYAPGDDLRHLDWHVYGRLGRLLVRLYEQEEDLFVYLLLDASASMGLGQPHKIDYGKQLVAALAYVALANLDRVSVSHFSTELPMPEQPARGKGRIFTLLARLGAIAPNGAADLTSACRALVQRAKRRGVVVVVSDFFDAQGGEAAIDVLRHHRFEPLAVQVVDEAEARPPARGDLELVDAETGERRALTLTPRIASAIGRAHDDLSQRLATFCAARGVPYLKASTQVPFDEQLLRLFREAGVLV